MVRPLLGAPLLIAALLAVVSAAPAAVPQYKVSPGGLDLARVSADCPMIYDNDGVAITVPRQGTNVKAMEDEFFATMTNQAVYGGRK